MVVIVQVIHFKRVNYDTYISKTKYWRKLKQVYRYTVDLGIKRVLFYKDPYTCCWLAMDLALINLRVSCIIHSVVNPTAQDFIMVTDHSLLSHFTPGGILYFSRGNNPPAVYIPLFPSRNTFSVYTRSF